MLKTIITKLCIYIGIVNKYLVIFWSLKSIPLRFNAFGSITRVSTII